jgi:FkbM family methyltransferase
LQLIVFKTFKLSSDPRIVENVRDVGLNLAPPQRAQVLCVDENSQVQALDHTQLLLPMQPGQVSRLEAISAVPETRSLGDSASIMERHKGVTVCQRMKKLANYVANNLVLAPFGLTLSINIGNDPIQDMARLLKAHPVKSIVDGGAHTGHFSRQMASALPSSKIEAFEPASETYRALKRAIAKWPGIRAHKLALGAASEIRTFHNNAAPQTSSLKCATVDGEKYFGGLITETGREDVLIVALGDFCREHGIDQIDIIKLDLQGGEMDALKGAGDMVATAMIVFIEVCFLRIYEDSALFSDLDMFLRSKGFDLYQVYDLVRSPSDGRLLHGDAMFVQRALLTALG